MNSDLQRTAFAYLYNIRESGISTLSAASRAIAEVFNLGQRDAQQMVLAYNEHVRKSEDPNESSSNCFKVWGEMQS